MTNAITQFTKDYFDGNDLAAEVWYSKYKLNSSEQSPLATLGRLIHAFHSEEQALPKFPKRKLRKLSSYGQNRFAKKQDATYIYNLLAKFQGIIPGGSILANLGTEKYSSTSNCFYIELEDDSMESIFKLGAQLASIFKYRGGCGIDITKLRPNGALVHNAANTSSGAVSFMPLFSEIARVVGQDGRRAAMMISLSIDHPDAEAFIKIKQDLKAVTGANISLKITNEFYQAIQENRSIYIQYWTPTGKKYTQKELYENLGIDVTEQGLGVLVSHELISGEVLYTKIINPVALYNEFIKANHSSAEPGLLFWDNMLDYSMSSYYPQYKELGTNPCSEIPLGDKDACRLFALNLAGLTSSGIGLSEKEIFAKLYSLFYEQVVLANYLIELELVHIDRILKKINNKHSIEYQLWADIRKMTITGRRIGCGITGLFDWLIFMQTEVMKKLEVKESLAEYLTEQLFSIKCAAELDASIDLAILFKPFKGYTKKETSKFIDMIKEEFPDQYARMCKYGRRNVSLSTVAPTGTISILGQCSSGIEPIFAPYYIRRRKVGADEVYDSIDVDGEKFKHYTVVHPGLAKWAEGKFTHTNWEEIYKQSPYYGWSAGEISISFRLSLQAIAQHYTSHAISSTINLPQETTVEQIKEIYDTAFKYNLKGLTVYREGSRQGILVTAENTTNFAQYDAPKRPKILSGDIYKIKVKGTFYVIVIGLYQQKPYEIFAAETTQVITSQKGKITKLNKGIYKWEGENGEVIENLNILSEDSAERATTIYLSMLMRQGAKISYIIKAAKKADGNIITFTSAICRILGKYLTQEGHTEVCPDCGGKLIREAGCTKCTDCTYSLCLMIIHEIKN